MYDLNSDGVKELLIAKNDNHATSVDVFTMDVKNRKLIEIGSFGSWGSIRFYPEEKHILVMET